MLAELPKDLRRAFLLPCLSWNEQHLCRQLGRSWAAELLWPTRLAVIGPSTADVRCSPGAVRELWVICNVTKGLLRELGKSCGCLQKLAFHYLRVDEWPLLAEF